MENLIYFIANLEELPKKAFENNIFVFQNTKYIYSFLGVTQENYNLYIKDYPHEIIDGETVVIGSRWWGEVRAEKKFYAPSTNDGSMQRVVVSISESDAEKAVTLMKIFARKIIEREISLGTPYYNNGIIDLFENASTISDLNILYEDYIGVPMPCLQASALNRFTEDGQRIYNENRLIISAFGSR